MKKIFLFLIIVFVSVLAGRDNKYLNYTNSLIHYKFELKNFDDIKAPFEEKLILKNAQKIQSHSLLTKKTDVKLISVLDNSAYIKINKYTGDKLVKSYKKWVKKGDVFEKYYKVKKIKLDKIILQFKNKLIIKTLNKKIPGIKEK